MTTTKPPTLTRRLWRAAEDAVSEAYGKEMRPILLAAGFSERRAAFIRWAPPFDAPISGNKVVAQITVDADENEAREVVKMAARVFYGTAPTLQEISGEATTLTTAFVIDGVEVEMWGVVERRDPARIQELRRAGHTEAQR